MSKGKDGSGESKDVPKILGVLVKMDMSMNNVEIEESALGPLLGAKNRTGVKKVKCNHLENFVVYVNERCAKNDLNFIASIIALKPLKGACIISDGTLLSSQKVLETFFNVQKMVQGNPKMAAALQTNLEFRNNAAEALVKVGEIANRGKVTPDEVPASQVKTLTNGQTSESSVKNESKVDPGPAKVSYHEGGIHYLVGASYD